MLGRQDHERGPEQRVRPRREDAELLAARVVVGRRRVEHDLAALGPADPVRLLDPDRLGELDLAEVEQLVRVLRDAQVPLVEVALLDLRAAAPAVAVGALDLLAGQRPVVRAPVDRRLRAVGQAGLQELQEEPLVPAVVVGVAGDDLGAPVERRAHLPQLAAHVGDVRHRPVARVDPVLDRRVLGRQPEGIEPDRQEHVLAVHPPEAGERVGRRLDVPVPDVDVARRVGVHRQQVVAVARLGEVRPVQLELLPALLPARFDRARVVALDAGSLVPVGGGRRVGGRVGHGLPRIWITPRRAGEGYDGVGGVRIGSGGATGTRTPDPLHAMQVLSQLSYSPTERRIVPDDPLLTRRDAARVGRSPSPNDMRHEANNADGRASIVRP